MKKQLYFGDNLNVLRDQIADASVDLIYLDPPFNSKRDYNLLFKSPKAASKKAKLAETISAEEVFSNAQITAFEDTWHWGMQAETEFREIEKQPNTDLTELMRALRSFLRENDMMAYLTCMAIRLLELHRVLKETGSLYLHCDPTASHYLKLVLDAVFGKENYRNEIIWQRTPPKTHAFTRFASSHDVLFYYSKSNRLTWNAQFIEHRQEYLDSHYNQVEAETGRRYMLDNLQNPSKNRPNLTYEFPPGSGTVKVWRWTRDRMLKAYEDGLIYLPPKGGVARYKRYLDEMEGTPVTSVWTDISPINSQAAERLGYPTQKPLALLERIIAASSNEKDVILDPFCGCGTALDAAQHLKRQWIGIDITHLSIGLIERRLKERYPALKKKGAFEITGRPTDLATARRLAELDKYQFQFWALSLIGAQPFKGGKKGADGGVDGLIFPEVGKGKTEKIIVSVKGGENVGVLAIRDLVATVSREKAAVGALISLVPPTKAMLSDAAAAGFYDSPHHGQFPKIQILTIEGLLAETERLKFVDMSYGGQTFKAAKAQESGKRSDNSELF
jgi:site-specific DNA-methyltransferase (adenine-specific)